MRRITEQEMSLVKRLLACGVAGADALRSQLPNSHVYPINDDETILRFRLSPDAVPASLPYKQNVAVEAVARDLDEGRVEVLLHVKDGLIYELEYVKTDGSRLQRRPTEHDLSGFVAH
jgi:Domain of unknown function (DUF6984)